MIGEIINHYKIVEKLGGGGMGIVYKAEDLKLGRYVALKFLPHALSMDENYKQVIINEAKIAASLDHPNICTVYEVGETEDEQIFIAMAYYDGSTIKHQISQNLISLPEIESIALQIAKGLEHAHKRGIIHRDIKPANIFITEVGEVKILDFGIAKIEGDYSALDSENVKGTISYMSPEQLMGKDVDQRTDIWAFGVLLYELVTGKKPFGNEYEQSAIYSILNEEPELTESNLLAIPYLKTIIPLCLMKNPEERFKSFSEIFTNIINSQSHLKLKEMLVKEPQGINTLRFRWILIIGLIAALILISVTYMYIGKSDLTLTERDYVMVSDFKNLTNESIFDYSISEAMSVALRQSSKFKIFPKHRVIKTLSLMKLPIDQKIDLGTSLNVAIREGIPFIVSGEVNKNNNNYIISSSIINVNSRETIHLHLEVSENINSILDCIDKLAILIREDLGESTQNISQNSFPLAKVTTNSLEALDLYSRGDLLEIYGKYSEAIKFKEEALAIDTLFVKAISDLSYNYYKVGNLSKAVEYHNKVLPLIHMVSEYEKLSMLTVYYGPTFEMDYTKAFEYAKKWTLLYPDDAYAYAHLGHLAMFTGDYSTAIKSNIRAKELDPSISGTLDNNSGYAFALSGDPINAIRHFKSSQVIRPNYSIIDVLLGRAYWMTNQFDSAMHRFKIALDKSEGIEKAKILSHIITQYHLLGELENGILECNNAITICRTLKRQDEESYFHYMKGELELAKGNTGNYLHEMSESDRLCSAPYYEYALVGLSYARNGFYSKLDILVQKLKSIKSNDPHFVNRVNSYLNYLNGYSFIKEKNYKKSIECFGKVAKLYSGDPIYLMAQNDIAHYSSKIDKNMAKKYYENILNYSGEIFLSNLPTVRKCGIWVGKIYNESNYELGLILLDEKDTTNAFRYISNALNLIKNPTYLTDRQTELYNFLKNKEY